MTDDTFTTYEYKAILSPGSIDDIDEDTKWAISEKMKVAMDSETALLVFGPSWKAPIDTARQELFEEIDDRVLFRKLRKRYETINAC